MRTFTPSYFRRNFVLHSVLTLVTGGIWLMIAIPYWVLFKASRRLIIDGTAVRYQTGILSRSLREINVNDVRSIKVDQGFWGRFWGVGDIEISSASGFDDQIIIRGVGSPDSIRRMLRDMRGSKDE